MQRLKINFFLPFVVLPFVCILTYPLVSVLIERNASFILSRCYNGGSLNLCANSIWFWGLVTSFIIALVIVFVFWAFFIKEKDSKNFVFGLLFSVFMLPVSALVYTDLFVYNSIQGVSTTIVTYCLFIIMLTAGLLLSLKR